MRVIFCADPVVHSEPDPLYIDEVAAATHAGCPFYLIDYKALVQDDNPARAVRDVPVHQPIEDAVYRGWDLTVRQYKMLYDAPVESGLASHQCARRFSVKPIICLNFLPLIEAHTPRTVWIHSDGKHISDDAIMHALDVFRRATRDIARFRAYPQTLLGRSLLYFVVIGCDSSEAHDCIFSWISAVIAWWVVSSFGNMWTLRRLAMTYAVASPSSMNIACYG
jgi:hypothetical protein